MVWRPDHHSASNDSYEQSHCGKKARAYFSVSYSEPLPGFERHSPKNDIFGLCHEHANEYRSTGILRWNLQTRHPKCNGWTRFCLSVYGQRGHISFVEECAPPNGDNVKQRLVDQFRGQIIRLMGQHNARSLTEDDWRSIFESALSEHTVRSVMEG